MNRKTMVALSMMVALGVVMQAVAMPTDGEIRAVVDKPAALKEMMKAGAPGDAAQIASAALRMALTKGGSAQAVKARLARVVAAAISAGVNPSAVAAALMAAVPPRYAETVMAAIAQAAAALPEGAGAGVVQAAIDAAPEAVQERMTEVAADPATVLGAAVAQDVVTVVTGTSVPDNAVPDKYEGQ